MKVHRVMDDTMTVGIRELRSRSKITFTSLRFSRLPLRLPVLKVTQASSLISKQDACSTLYQPRNHLGIFRKICKVYFLTTP